MAQSQRSTCVSTLTHCTKKTGGQPLLTAEFHLIYAEENERDREHHGTVSTIRTVPGRNHPRMLTLVMGSMVRNKIICFF